MRILFLMPRLDCSFKIGYVPKEREHIDPIRLHWIKFRKCVQAEHESRGDYFNLLEKPLWQFTVDEMQELCEIHKYDVIYIPHKEFRNFPIIGKTRPLYYMQTQFPWIFSVDCKGWGSGASAYPFNSVHSINSAAYDKLREICKTGKSKFGQPERGTNLNMLPKDKSFIFFPCQLPHDETIKFHSSVSVEDALKATCTAAINMGVSLVIKGHPVNPDSMAPLKDIVSNFTLSHRDRIQWIDIINIQDVLERALVTVTVNSGVGFESLLMGTPVITLGEAEYDTVSIKAHPHTLSLVLSDNFTNRYGSYDLNGFFQHWTNWTYDTTDANSFRKLRA